jgi:hypothetical protein
MHRLIYYNGGHGNYIPDEMNTGHSKLFTGSDLSSPQQSDSTG